MAEKIDVVGISGSLRAKSLNTALLRIAQTQLPANMTLEITDIGGVPLFNQDLESNLPESVVTLKRKIREADGLLIATPEYNFSIPGVLKNAIDWVSRPVKESALDGKPVALIGAAGISGTIRAQMHFHNIAMFTNMRLLPRPQLYVQQAFQKFDAEGNLTDAATKEKLGQLLVAFAEWIVRWKS
ncbi:MAG TPA: NADPH-dependent FMN reductase [Bacteroidota bacterium]|nr:NADPH-dependent FMN reductase [Bacteroidota bacterium]